MVSTFDVCNIIYKNNLDINHKDIIGSIFRNCYNYKFNNVKNIIEINNKNLNLIKDIFNQYHIKESVCTKADVKNILKRKKYKGIGIFISHNHLIILE